MLQSLDSDPKALVRARRRLLRATEAAAYFDISKTQFERLQVGRVCFGASVRYDLVAMDAYLNELSGLTSPGLPPIPTAIADNPEAALERFRSLQSSASG